MTKDVLTTGDVARLCGVTIRTVIKWFEAGRLEGYRLPGSRDRRFTRAAVERFVHGHGLPAELLAPAREGPPRVLVADDDAAVRRLVERCLRELGTLDVATAATGWEAGLRTAAWRPDVLLLDYRLGDTTGEEVAAGVRALDPAYRPAIVVMSAFLQPEDVQRVLRRGADAFLAKPFELDELRRLVLRHAGLPVA
jgi:excisionase family DNA binding protein